MNGGSSKSPERQHKPKPAVSLQQKRHSGQSATSSTSRRKKKKCNERWCLNETALKRNHRWPLRLVHRLHLQNCATGHPCAGAMLKNSPHRGKLELSVSSLRMGHTKCPSEPVTTFLELCVSPLCRSHPICCSKEKRLHFSKYSSALCGDHADLLCIPQ